MTNKPDDFNQILDSCLDQIFGHGDSIEQCLERHPDYASELYPLLQTAMETREALAYIPSPNAKAIAWARLQQAITSHQAPNPWRHMVGILQSFSTRLSGPYRWAATATAALLIVVIGGTGVVTASAGSLPDQPLYPVKRVVERTQMALTFNDQSKARFHATLAERRMMELAAMGTKGNNVYVERLAGDLDLNLKRVRQFAIPGIPVPALAVTPSVQPGGIFNDPGQDDIRMTIRPTDRETARALFRLVTQLQRGLDRHDQELRNAYLTAPESVRQELRIAHREAQKKYLGLIQAMSMVARGSDLPAFEETLQSGR